VEECGRPDYLRQQCEGSLRRLGVEQIDLFQLHRIDPTVDADEQFGLLKTLRDEGKVREVGLSEVSVAQIDAARRVVPSSACRTTTTLPNVTLTTSSHTASCTTSVSFPWFPLGSGKLSAPGGPLEASPRNSARQRRQISLAWLLRRSPIMLPIPGTSSLEHLEENCAAARVTLSDDMYQELTDSRNPYDAGR
jgi:pyridoxine 4-dehydrogenase